MLPNEKETTWTVRSNNSSLPNQPYILKNSIIYTLNNNINAPGIALLIMVSKKSPSIFLLLGWIANRVVAIPRTTSSSIVKCVVLNGNGESAAIEIIASRQINMFFITYKDADCWMLLTTLLPCATTLGSELKLLSVKTMWATFLAESAPLATVIAQSESFIAKISLTPSPVIATVCPALFIALTRTAFWSGVTRPKTV